ncbi:MAG: 8-amino-7-oxononanoate synthase [Rhizomicrobium sp.]|nr:8-amino-7-oxononanoate synthase [Rhizomicrobium sp.]
MTLADPYRDYCRLRDEANLLRQLRDAEPLAHGQVRRGGRDFVNLASNDYLGLSRHPALIQAAQAYAEAFGSGSTASRLVTGNHPAYAAIEERIATGKGKEAALLLASGYQTNLTVIAALADKAVVKRPVTILADRLVHHSILQGAVLSGARLQRFGHNDLYHLETLLQARRGEFVLIASESVFGMDGDRADLAALGELATRYGAMLYIDEAHATGVLGKDGFGLVADCPLAVDVAMGTFGKALGSFGSYIACSKLLRDYLVQRCGGLIYSTALPPPVLGSIAAALELLPNLVSDRAGLLELAEALRTALRGQGWDCGASTTQIIPVLVGAEAAVLELAARLEAEGFLVAAIRPPTVPAGTARLRLSLSAAHRPDDIARFITVMARLAVQFASAA